jgi:hypothetical protein
MTADNAYRAKAWQCLSLAECTNNPEERAEIVRFASMWMSWPNPLTRSGAHTSSRTSEHTSILPRGISQQHWLGAAMCPNL